MTREGLSGFQLNRRQLLAYGTAASAANLLAVSGMAQDAELKRPGCVEVACWYSTTLATKSIDPTKVAEANRLSAENITTESRNLGRALGAPGASRSPVAFNTNAVNSTVEGKNSSDAFQRALSGSLTAPQTQEGRIQQGIVDRLKLWDKSKTITFAFVDTSSRLTAYIRAAATEWKRFCGLNLQETSSANGAHIRISFVAGQGHYSLVGTDSQIPQFSPNNSGRFESLNLDPNGGDDRYLEGTALHEFGHAVGFVHEHQNPNNPIVFNRTEVLNFYARTQKWTNKTIQENILAQLTDTTRYAATQRDVNSVMHYTIPRSLVISGNLPSGNNLVLSCLDKTLACQQYRVANCPDCNGQTSTPEPEKVQAPTERELLKPENAKELKLDTVTSTDASADSHLQLFKLSVSAKELYVVETVDGALLGETPKASVPVQIELFDQTNFATGKAIKTSTFGDAKSIGVQDAYLTATLEANTTYYIVAQPVQRFGSSEKSAFRLLLRKEAGKRPKEFQDKSWSDLRERSKKLADDLTELQNKNAENIKKLRKRSQ